MWHRFTHQAKRIVFYAQEEAVAQGNTDVAPEHLLLGVLQEVLTHKEPKADKTVWPPAPTERLDPQNPVASLLRQPGADLERLQLETKSRAASLNRRADSNEIGLTPSAKKIIDTMYKEAKRVSPNKSVAANEMGAEFLLLALIQDEEGTAGKLLIQFGFDRDSARQKVAILHLSLKDDKRIKRSLLTKFAKHFTAKPKEIR